MAKYFEDIVETGKENETHFRDVNNKEMDVNFENRTFYDVYVANYS